MADTFGTVWRKVRLYCPAAPAPLVRDWVKDAFLKVVQARAWSWAYGTWEVQVRGLAEGTASIAQGSTTLALGTLPVTAADIGRQVRLPGRPLYTVRTINGTDVTIDRAWVDAPQAGTLFQVYTAYLTPPVDVSTLISVADFTTERRLSLNASEVDVHRADAIRRQVADPRWIAPFSPDPLTGQARWELYPHPASDRLLAVRYSRDLASPSDTMVLPGTLGYRSEILVTGALAFAARWPGTLESPNPYFSLPLAREQSQAFEQLIAEMELADEEVAPTWLDYPPADENPIGYLGALTPHPAYE